MKKQPKKPRGTSQRMAYEPKDQATQEKARAYARLFSTHTFWLAHKDKFYFKDPDADLYQPHSEKLLRVKFEQRGFFQYVDEAASNNDERSRFRHWLWCGFLDHVTTHHAIRWVGELAGWHQKIEVLDGHHVLIEQGPVLLDLVPGKYDKFEKFVQEFLPDGQADYFKSWVKNFATQLYDLRSPADFKPTQALFIGGEGNIGKTLMGTLFLKTAFGGRMSDANQVLLDIGAWNTSQSRCELALSDDMAITKKFNKAEYTALLKRWASGNQSQIRTRFNHEIEARLLRALMILFNTKSVSLNQLPDDGPDIADKLIILVASRTTFAIDLEEVIKELLNQVGPWLEYLINHYQIPECISVRGRYGILPYRHPELEMVLQESSIFERVKWLVEKLQFEREFRDFTTETMLIEMEINPDTERIVRGIGKISLGMNLSKLALKPDFCLQCLGRIEHNGSEKLNWWRILPKVPEGAAKGAGTAKSVGHNEIR